MAKSKGVFQVESITDHKVVEGRDVFKVHWLGYSKASDTWEPADNLHNCSTMVADYMEKRAATERRKSLRARRSDYHALSSDEESQTSSPKKRSKKPKGKMTTRSSATPQAKPVAISSKGSLKTNFTELSTDEEYSGNTRTTRLSLSETRFKKPLVDNSHSSLKTSTPAKSPQAEATTTKIRSSKRLTFDSQRQLPARGMLTRQKQKEMHQDKFIAEAPTTIAQAEEVVCVEEGSQGVETEQEASFPVTWREFALAAFVTGVAALGYICYSTDYCSY